MENCYNKFVRYCFSIFNFLYLILSMISIINDINFLNEKIKSLSDKKDFNLEEDLEIFNNISESIEEISDFFYRINHEKSNLKIKISLLKDLETNATSVKNVLTNFVGKEAEDLNKTEDLQKNVESLLTKIQSAANEGNIKLQKKTRWANKQDFFKTPIYKQMKEEYLQILNTPQGQLREAYVRGIGQNRLISEDLEASHAGLSAISVKEDIDKFIENYDSLLEEQEKNELRTIIDSLISLGKIDRKILSMRNLTQTSARENVTQLEETEKLENQQRFVDVISEIQTQIVELKNEKISNVILPCGYLSNVGEGGGHAVICSFQRQKNGKFSLTYINTGEGALELSDWFSKLKLEITNQTVDYVVENLDFEDIVDFDFLKGLIECRTLYSYNGELQKNNSIERFLNIIQKQLPEKSVSETREGRTHAMQANGTCTYHSILAWLETNMDPLVFELLNLFMIHSRLSPLSSLRESDTARLVGHDEKGQRIMGRALLEKVKKFSQNYFQQRKKDFIKQFKEQEARIDDNLKKMRAQEKELITQLLKLNVIGHDIDQKIYTLKRSQENLKSSNQGIFTNLILLVGNQLSNVEKEIAQLEAMKSKIHTQEFQHQIIEDKKKIKNDASRVQRSRAKLEREQRRLSRLKGISGNL